jgi:hypothetical protein
MSPGNLLPQLSIAARLTQDLRTDEPSAGPLSATAVSTFVGEHGAPFLPRPSRYCVPDTVTRTGHIELVQVHSHVSDII